MLYEKFIGQSNSTKIQFLSNLTTRFVFGLTYHMLLQDHTLKAFHQKK